VLQLTIAERNKGGYSKGLFWANMPFKPKNNLDFLGKLLYRTIYRYADYPFLIYTADRHIDFSVFYNNQKYFNKIKRLKKLQIFLYEPLSLYTGDKIYTNGYFSEFHSDFNGDIGSEELDSITELQERTGLQITVNTCDYNVQQLLQEKYNKIKLVCNDVFIKTNNVCHREIFTGKEKIIKKFWCGNGRYAPHRNLVAAYLQDKPGNYSWHHKANLEDIKNLNWPEENLPWDYLTEANKKLINNLPLIDVKSKHIQEVADVTHCHIPQMPQDLDDRIYNSYRESFCAIVNETRFAAPTGNISEKVFFAISFRTPFVLVACPNSLEYLKKLGFKSFDFLWDESYDKEQNHSKRLEKIFKIIDQINSYSIEELNQIYFSYEVQAVVSYNRRLLEKFPMTEIVL